MTGPSATSTPPGAPEIRFYLPAEGLRSLITSYYFLESVGPLVDFTHPEWANIRFALNGVWRFEGDESRGTIAPPRAVLFGPTDRARRFATEGGLVLGVGLVDADRRGCVGLREPRRPAWLPIGSVGFGHP